MKLIWAKSFFEPLKWYEGFLWYSLIRNTPLVCPIGVNLVLRLARRVWMWLIHPFSGLDVVVEKEFYRLRCDYLQQRIERLERATQTFPETYDELNR